MSLPRVVIATSIHPDFDARIWKQARLLASKGCKVQLICPWDVGPREIVDGVIIHPFKKVSARWKRPFLVPVRMFPKLFPLLRQADIVHFHDIDLVPWMTVLSLFKKVVYDVHENYAEEMLVREWIPLPLRHVLYYAVKWGQYLCSQVIRNIVLVAPSQEPDFSSGRLCKAYIYNYASVDLLNEMMEDHATRKNAVIFIGSQHVNNGSLLLLDIAEQAKSRLPGVRFLVSDRFFDPAFRRQFIAEVEHRGLGDQLTLIPNVKPHALMSVLNQATIGIVPNLRVPQQIKGIHTKIFEYMAAGLPVVASDLPHQISVIAAEAVGIVVPPEAPSMFVDAIEELVKKPDYARQLGMNGRCVFQTKYCYESQVDTLLGFYRHILES
jgi:glycosyltransferase involved in cell wall biosynthesis